MDESKLIDWYEVVEAVANGRTTGLVCPECGQSGLEAQNDRGTVRVRCPGCNEGFEGRLGSGRDDAFYAEADAMLERQRAARRSPLPTASTPDPAPQPAVAPAPGVAPTAQAEPEPEPAPSRPEPWTWELPAESQNDWDGYAVWAEVVESIYNGRRTGLICPLCSESLEDIRVEDPYIRVRCRVCGEGFEGRLG